MRQLKRSADAQAQVEREAAGLGVRRGRQADAGVRLKGVLLASPANPTGTIIPDAELEAIAEVCRERNIQPLGWFRGFAVAG